VVGRDRSQRSERHEGPGARYSRAMTKPAICTIGYERAKLADFLAALREADVGVLIDIRARAFSRRSEFNAKKLAASLKEAGIDYLHLPALGSPDPAREAAKSGDPIKFERLYRQQLATKEAEAALTRVQELASATPVCLMCYEREPSECHRQFTIEPLEARSGEKARHLFAAPPAKQGSLI
jgi:uncharacterized protein (DUF488 family)